MGLFDKIKQGLSKTKESIGQAVDNVLAAFVSIDEELFEELEEALIIADIGVECAMDITEKLRESVKLKRVTDPSMIKDLLAEIISEMLSEVSNEPMELDTKPSIILMVGVNGVGKTTSIGKLAARYKSEGKKVILGAADTFRAAAADQLSEWAKRAEVDIVRHKEGGDPSAVVFDTIAAAKSRSADLIICDTAGRLQNKANLMNELAKITRIIDRELPEAKRETLLVIDATTGQNGVMQAREFSKIANVTGIILTKLDGTAKGGIILAIAKELGIPVRFVGVGEGIDDLQDFDATDFAKAIF